MAHRRLELTMQQSLLIYTCSFDVDSTALRSLHGPNVKTIFDWKTRRRFARLRNFSHATRAT